MTAVLNLEQASLLFGPEPNSYTRQGLIARSHPAVVVRAAVSRLGSIVHHHRPLVAAVHGGLDAPVAVAGDEVVHRLVVGVAVGACAVGGIVVVTLHAVVVASLPVDAAGRPAGSWRD